jgi:hypothetical protein
MISGFKGLTPCAWRALERAPLTQADLHYLGAQLACSRSQQADGLLAAEATGSHQRRAPPLRTGRASDLRRLGLRPSHDAHRRQRVRRSSRGAQPHDPRPSVPDGDSRDAKEGFSLPAGTVTGPSTSALTGRPVTTVPCGSGPIAEPPISVSLETTSGAPNRCSACSAGLAERSPEATVRKATVR